MAEAGLGDLRRRKGSASALTGAVSATGGPQNPGYRIASKREFQTCQWRNGTFRCEFGTAGTTRGRGQVHRELWAPGIRTNGGVGRANVNSGDLAPEGREACAGILSRLPLRGTHQLKRSEAPAPAGLSPIPPDRRLPGCQWQDGTRACDIRDGRAPGWQWGTGRRRRMPRGVVACCGGIALANSFPHHRGPRRGLPARCLRPRAAAALSPAPISARSMGSRPSPGPRSCLPTASASRRMASASMVRTSRSRITNWPSTMTDSMSPGWPQCTSAEMMRPEGTRCGPQGVHHQEVGLLPDFQRPERVRPAVHSQRSHPGWRPPGCLPAEARGRAPRRRRDCAGCAR